MSSTKLKDTSENEKSCSLSDISCSPCSQDGKQTEALYHCIVCQMFYCQECISGHNKFTKNHSTTDKSSDQFGQIRGQSSELPADLCEEHQGEVVKMLCGQHDVVCCAVCIAAEHRSCEGVEYIPKTAKQLLEKEDKEKTKASLEQLKNELETLKSGIQNDLHTLNQRRDEIIDDVRQFVKDIITRVEELADTSLKEVRAKHKEITDEIKEDKEKADDMLKDVDSQLHKLKHPKNENQAQLFVDIKLGDTMLSRGNESIKRLTSRNATELVFLLNKKIEDYLRDIKSLGTCTGTKKEQLDANESSHKVQNYTGKYVSSNVKKQSSEKIYTCNECGRKCKGYTDYYIHKHLSHGGLK